MNDPGWWFTAVFVGIIAALFGSYLRDAISWVAARSSETLRARRDARLSSDRLRIDFLARHPDLLVMEMCRVLVAIIIFTGVAGFYISLPAFFDAVEKMPPLVDYGLAFPTTGLMNRLVLTLTGAFAMVAGYRAVLRLKLVSRARREYATRIRRLDTSP
jgi:hypothetical protein